jgi:hypothetical protein
MEYRKMKKIIFLMIFGITASNAQCYCTTDITMGFMNIRTDIEEILQNQANKINNDLIPEIRQNISDIREQNEVLEKLIKAEKERAIQLKQINFILEKVNNLE